MPNIRLIRSAHYCGLSDRPTRSLRIHTPVPRRHLTPPPEAAQDNVDAQDLDCGPVDAITKLGAVYLAIIAGSGAFGAEEDEPGDDEKKPAK